MKKNCSKCKVEFECKVDDVANCHCSSVVLPEETLAQLRKDFDNCLCAACLSEFAKL